MNDLRIRIGLLALAVAFVSAPSRASVVIDMPAPPRSVADRTAPPPRTLQDRHADVGQLALARYAHARTFPRDVYMTPPTNFWWGRGWGWGWYGGWPIGCWGRPAPYWGWSGGWSGGWGWHGGWRSGFRGWSGSRPWFRSNVIRHGVRW